MCSFEDKRQLVNGPTAATGLCVMVCVWGGGGGAAPGGERRQATNTCTRDAYGHELSALSDPRLFWEYSGTGRGCVGPSGPMRSTAGCLCPFADVEDVEHVCGKGKTSWEGDVRGGGADLRSADEEMWDGRWTDDVELSLDSPPQAEAECVASVDLDIERIGPHLERMRRQSPGAVQQQATVCARVGGGGGGATPAQPASGGGCLPQPRWAVCATGAGAHQGHTSREGEKDIWWTAGTARGGTGHLGLTHTETQRARLQTACGQRRVDSENSQTTPATTSTSSIRQLLGATDAQTAHHATFSTTPTHQLLGSANAETTPARAPATAADRKQRPDATCEGKNG